MINKYIFYYILVSSVVTRSERIPVVIGTWGTPGFQTAVQTAWNSLAAGEGRMSALVNGLSTCERLQCDYTVGWDGSPDENAETTLDAMVMDGPRHAVGAVAQLRRVRDAARVAWAVLNHTRHTLIVGEDATQFALKMGFDETSLSSNHSKVLYKKWIAKNCQPNFWKNVIPNSAKSCGPYRPSNQLKWSKSSVNSGWSDLNHDTISMIVVDQDGYISTGTSSNGATFKIPGRVGDAPIPGAGAYVDTDAGAAVATGDGDIMMRFSPSAMAVQYMRQDIAPDIAVSIAMRHIRKYYPGFFGALVAVNRRGVHGAACSGMDHFQYSVNNAPITSSKPLTFNDTFVVTIKCLL